MLQRSLNLRMVPSNMIGLPVSARVIRRGALSITRSSSSSNTKELASEHEQQQPASEQVSKLLDDASSYADLGSTEWATTPYPASAAPEALADDSKPKRNPSDTSIILFPGQGIIRVGDVKQYLKFPRVRELFDIANDILGYDLLKMCLKGPQKLLDRTEFNQPATVVTSLAALEKLQEERPRAIESCVGVAGYSVGELTALMFAGAVPYEEGLRLVGVRANAMQAASELSPQGMISCYCTPAAKVSSICDQAQKWAMDIGATNPICK